MRGEGLLSTSPGGAAAVGSMRNPDGGGVEEAVDDPYLIGEEQPEAETEQSRTDDQPLMQ